MTENTKSIRPAGIVLTGAGIATNAAGIRSSGRSAIDRKYFYGIDIARIFAALMVGLFHLGFWAWTADPIAAAWQQRTRPSFATVPGAFVGWLGVEIFFVISGVVIANAANGQSPFQFLTRRILRLYPAVWTCTAITAIVYGLAGTQIRLKVYLLTLTLLPAGHKLDAVYWTLNLEILFYGFIFIFLATKHFPSLGLAAWMLTLPGLALSVVHLATNLDFAVDPAAIPLFGAAGWERLLLLRYGSFFALGIWLWLYSEGGRAPNVTGGLVLALAVSIGAVWDRAEAILRTAHFTASPMIPVVVWLLAAAGLFAAAQVGSVSRASAAERWIRRLGLMTYPFYLLHNNVGRALLGFLVNKGLEIHAAIAATFTVVLVLSWAVCVLGEPPIRVLLRAFLEKLENLALARGPNRMSIFHPDR